LLEREEKKKKNTYFNLGARMRLEPLSMLFLFPSLVVAVAVVVVKPGAVVAPLPLPLLSSSLWWES
jgi:hypothetical protein